jgi:hypothetical protein
VCNCPGCDEMSCGLPDCDECDADQAEEAHDRAGEQWQEAAYQPAPPDPYSGGVS